MSFCPWRGCLQPEAAYLGKSLEQHIRDILD